MGQQGIRDKQPGMDTATCAGVTDTPTYGGHQALCTDQLNLAAQVGVMGTFSLEGSTGQDGGQSRSACSQP